MACAEVNTQVGVSRTVATTEVASGNRNFASSTTRTGERSNMPGSRQVSCGLSDSTVPMPTRMASLAARIWNTRVARRLAGDRRRLAAGEAGLAVGRDRKLQRHIGPLLA